MATNRQSFSAGAGAGFVPSSGIRDNHSRGSVGEFLREKIRDGSSLSVVSAYFTIYAFDALCSELETIAGMRFLFGEPRFIGSIDPDRTDKKAFKIEDEGLTLANRLQQKQVARDCAAWIEAKAKIRSVRQTICCTARCITLPATTSKTPFWGARILRFADSV